jgi:hypothetical protein
MLLKSASQMPQNRNSECNIEIPDLKRRAGTSFGEVSGHSGVIIPNASIRKGSSPRLLVPSEINYKIY